MIRPLLAESEGGGGHLGPWPAASDPPTLPPTPETFCAGKKLNLLKRPEIGGLFRVRKLFLASGVPPTNGLQRIPRGQCPKKIIS